MDPCQLDLDFGPLLMKVELGFLTHPCCRMVWDGAGEREGSSLHHSRVGLCFCETHGKLVTLSNAGGETQRDPQNQLGRSPFRPLQGCSFQTQSSYPFRSSLAMQRRPPALLLQLLPGHLAQLHRPEADRGKEIGETDQRESPLFPLKGAYKMYQVVYSFLGPATSRMSRAQLSGFYRVKASVFPHLSLPPGTSAAQRDSAFQAEAGPPGSQSCWPRIRS